MFMCYLLYMCMQTIPHYGSMYVSMYEIPISLHPYIIAKEEEGILLVICIMSDIPIMPCALMQRSICTSVCHHHIIIFECHCVIGKHLFWLLCCYHG